MVFFLSTVYVGQLLANCKSIQLGFIVCCVYCGAKWQEIKHRKYWRFLHMVNEWCKIASIGRIERETQISRCGAVNRMLPIMAHTTHTRYLQITWKQRCGDGEWGGDEKAESRGGGRVIAKKIANTGKVKKKISITLIFMIMTGLRPFTCPVFTLDQLRRYWYLLIKGG